MSDTTYTQKDFCEGLKKLKEKIEELNFLNYVIKDIRALRKMIPFNKYD